MTAFLLAPIVLLCEFIGIFGLLLRALSGSLKEYITIALDDAERSFKAYDIS
jgi:hypothetical protein